MANDNAKEVVNEQHEYLTVDEMLATDDVEYRDILAWGGKYVRIGSLSADKVAEWRDTAEGPAKRTMGIRLFVDSLVDNTGKRIGGPQYYKQFQSKSNAIIERVLGEIIDLNGMSVKKDKETKNA